MYTHTYIYKSLGAHTHICKSTYMYIYSTYTHQYMYTYIDIDTYVLYVCLCLCKVHCPKKITVLLLLYCMSLLILCRLSFDCSPANLLCSCSLFTASVSVMDGVKEVRVEAVPYCCSTCDGGEVTCRNLARRGPKTRSLSTSSASSSSEYRLVHCLKDHKWGYRLWKKLCVFVD